MTVHEFDALRAIREEIAGLREVEKVVTVTERRAERALSEAEAELTAARKISGFVRAEIARKLAVAERVEQEREEGR